MLAAELFVKEWKGKDNLRDRTSHNLISRYSKRNKDMQKTLISSRFLMVSQTFMRTYKKIFVYKINKKILETDFASGSRILFM